LRAEKILSSPKHKIMTSNLKIKNSNMSPFCQREKRRSREGFLIWISVFVAAILMYKFVNKDSLMQVIYQSLPGKEAGLLDGMLLGNKTGFDKDFWNQLKNSGLVHLVVVSGTNMILVFRSVIENLAKWLGRKKAIGIGFLIGLIYVGMVGWQIPVVRALILVSVMYWAQVLGRKYDVIRGLILSVLIIALAWPGSFGEISFWLSFTAFIGVISSPWKGNFGTTCWVSLWVSPVLAIGFGTLNIISPISNLLVLFTVESITVIGFVGSLIGVFVPMLGKIILWVIWPLLKYFGVVAGMIGSWKWVSLNINFNWLILFGWYLILISILLKIKKYKFVL
jgi:competence protein ComEC